MKSILGATLALALLAPNVALAVKPAPKAVAVKKVVARNWLATATHTPEGAIVIGNPAAKVKLVEYLSLTCPHCAVLSGEAMEPLRQNYIAKGLVSIEVRHAVRDGYDLVASLLTRCQPAADYLPSIEGLFATQQVWMEKGMRAAGDSGFAGKSPDQQMSYISHAAGFDAFFAKRGMTPQRYAACLGNQAGKDQLAQMAQNSWQRDAIPGTPAIKINGQMQENIASWAQLEEKIKAAL